MAVDSIQGNGLGSYKISSVQTNLCAPQKLEEDLIQVLA